MPSPIKPQTGNRIFPKFTLANKIVGFFVASIIITGFLQNLEIIDLRGFFLSFSQQSVVYNIEKEAIIGVPYEYDFSWMKSPDCSEPCYFQTTAMEGFVPLGLQLWPDGKLKGTPTGKSSSFEVCVIDATGKTTNCKKFTQNVYPTAEAKNLATKNYVKSNGTVSTKSSTNVWSGTYTYGKNFDNQGPITYNTDKFTLSFSQSGNNIKGSYTQYYGEERVTENINGTIIGTRIKFNDDWCPATNIQSSICFRFAGTISGNSIKLNAERCSFNTFCPSRYSVSVENPAIKGTITLTK